LQKNFTPKYYAAEIAQYKSSFFSATPLCNRNIGQQKFFQNNFPKKQMLLTLTNLGLQKNKQLRLISLF